MPTASLTQKRLKELLLYYPDSGVFTWKVTRGRAVKGMIAGYAHHSGYRFIRINGKDHRAHRLAFLYITGKFPSAEVDHINHVRNDNRWKNLRPATNKLNSKNRKLPSNNKSGRVGVGWHKAVNKWQAYIRVNKKLIHLGRYTTFKKACAARNAAERKYGFHANHGK